jgi:dTDP-4-amino-4,6-dideoxygalactose transaminase
MVPPQETIIEKEASYRQESKQNIRFTNSCRNALSQILHQGKSKNNLILLPAYVGLSLEEGSGILDPVIDSGLKFQFYKIDKEFNPVIDDLKEKIKQFSPNYLLFVNYFGWEITNRDELLELVKSFGIISIEDNAHCLENLFAEDEVNQEADYQIYSIHKFLGTQSGGAIKSRHSLDGIIDTIQMHDLLEFSKCSPLSILAKRMKNFHSLMRYLRTSEQEIYSLLHKTAPRTALNLPIIFKNHETRHLYYTKLTEAGIMPTALYHRLTPQIHKEDFGLSYSLSDRILNLPIHQDVDDSQIEIMYNVLCEIS